MAQFCQSCGAALEDGARFCPSCGAPVAQAAPQTPPQQPYQQPVYQQPAYQQSVYQQPVYQQYAPAAPAVKPREGAPGGSKVMMIFFLIAFLFAQGLNAFLIVANGPSANNWLQFALTFTFGLTAVILLMLGVFIKKAPWLYGIGLTLISVINSISAFRVILTGTAREIAIINVLYVLFYSLPILLAALHYFLGGRGFKGGLKNAMMIIAFVYGTFSSIVNLVSFIDMMTRYGSLIPALIISMIVGFVSFFEMLFLFIATLSFTVRRSA